MSVLDEVLQSCLGEMEAGEATVDQCLLRRAEMAEELAPLLMAAEQYRRAPRVAPSAAFRASARTRMLNMMAAAQPEPDPVPRARRWHPRAPKGLLLRAALLYLALLLAVAGVAAAAASDASPSSPLYPAKLALEELRLRLAVGDERRAEIALAMAERRAGELAREAASGAPADLSRVVDRHEAAVTAALTAAAGPDAAKSALVSLESRLAHQQELLMLAGERLEAEGRTPPPNLEGAIDLLRREREELRSRLGGALPEDPVAPAGDQGTQRHRHQAPTTGAEPGAAAGPSPATPAAPMETATADATPLPEPSPVPPHQAGQLREPLSTATPPRVQQRWGQTPDPTPSGGSTSSGPVATPSPMAEEPSSPPTETPVPWSPPPPTPEATPRQEQHQQQGPPPTVAPSPTPVPTWSMPTVPAGPSPPAPTATPVPTQPVPTGTVVSPSPPTATPMPPPPRASTPIPRATSVAPTEEPRSTPSPPSNPPAQDAPVAPGGGSGAGGASGAGGR